MEVTSKRTFKMRVTLSPKSDVLVDVCDTDSPLDIVDSILSNHMDSRKRELYFEKRTKLAIMVIKAYHSQNSITSISNPESL